MIEYLHLKRLVLVGHYNSLDMWTMEHNENIHYFYWFPSQFTQEIYRTFTMLYTMFMTPYTILMLHHPTQCTQRIRRPVRCIQWQFNVAFDKRFFINFKIECIEWQTTILSTAPLFPPLTFTTGMNYITVHF